MENNFKPKTWALFLGWFLSLVIKLSLKRNLYSSPSFTSIFKNKEEIVSSWLSWEPVQQKGLVRIAVSVSHLGFSTFHASCANTSLRSIGVCNVPSFAESRFSGCSIIYSLRIFILVVLCKHNLPGSQISAMWNLKMYLVHCKLPKQLLVLIVSTHRGKKEALRMLSYQ